MLLGTHRARNGAIVAIVCAPILRVVATRMWPVMSDLNDQAFPFVFDSLAIGCLLAIARDTLEANKRYVALLDSKVFWLVPAVCIAALMIEKPIFNLGIGVSLGNLGIALAIHKCVPDLRKKLRHRHGYVDRPCREWPWRATGVSFRAGSRLPNILTPGALR